MASLQGVLYPNIDNSLEELELQSTDQTIPDAPDLGDYGAAAFDGAVKSGITYTLGAMAYGAGSPHYSQDQLTEIYPDVPEETWKGGANAFQAEFLADKYKHEVYKRELYDFVSGVSDPQAGAGRGLVTDTIGGLAELGGGLIDPLTLGTFMATGAGVRALQTPLTKVAPMFMKSIARSRITTMVAAEVAENVVGDVAVTYPLRKFVLDDYEKTDTTLTDTVAQAIGSAVAFSSVKYAYGSTIGKFYKRNAGAEFMEKMKDENFSKTKDKVNSHLNSDNANQAAFEEAATHTATSPLGGERSSVSERMSTKAFDSGNTAKFDGTKAPFFGVYDKESGKADYSGDRFGDTHVFVSSPEAAQGLFDMYAKNGKEYSVYGHRGDLNLIDLESQKAVDHPDILDILDEEQGRRYLENINDDSTLADAFREVNNIAQEEGASGRDTSDMFDRINTILAGDGYDGTTHFENQGNTRHTVMSVFDEAMRAEDISELHKGTSDKPLEPQAEDNIVARTDEPFTTLEGKKVDISEPLPPDQFYDLDEDFSEKLAKYNDPSFLAEVKAGEGIHEKYDTMIEEHLSEVEAEVAESLRQVQEVIVETDKNISDKVYFTFHDNPVAAPDGWVGLGAFLNEGHTLDKIVGEVLVHKESGMVRNAYIEKDFRRMGIATRMYNELERVLGKELLPDIEQSADAKAFWENRFREKEYLKLEEQVKAVKEELKNNSPEQEPEVAKAMENCIRKNL